MAASDTIFFRDDHTGILRNRVPPICQYAAHPVQRSSGFIVPFARRMNSPSFFRSCSFRKICALALHLFTAASHLKRAYHRLLRCADGSIVKCLESGDTRTAASKSAVFSINAGPLPGSTPIAGVLKNRPPSPLPSLLLPGIIDTSGCFIDYPSPAS